MASSSGVICNAGFGTTTEALYLNKKLLVIPMKTQYEQLCNAAMLKTMGVTVIKKLHPDNIEKILTWIATAIAVEVDYPDNTKAIIDKICKNHAESKQMDIKFEEAHYSWFQ